MVTSDIIVTNSGLQGSQNDSPYLETYYAFIGYSE